MVECRALGGYFAKDEYLDWGYDQIIKMFDWLNNDGIGRILGAGSSYASSKRFLNNVARHLKLEETVTC